MAVLLVTTDLMAMSSAEGAARTAGTTLAARSPAQAVAACDPATRLVAIDLTAPIAHLPTFIDALRSAAPAAAMVAYGPHVHEARLQAAREAGCDLVISRGQFYKQLTELVIRYARSDA